MNLSSNQRKIYLMAVALLIAAVALACSWSLWERPAGVGATPVGTPPPAAPTEAPDATAGPTPALSEETSAAAGKASTVVYYQDNYGYLVPVQCRVPMQDGIAKATLGMMVQSVGNDMQAARLGLRTVLPENTSIDLDIHDGLARVDLGAEVLNMADAAAESNMVQAVVQTLTEFDSVDRVEFLIGGRKLDKLTHGTGVAGEFTRGDINLESCEPTLARGDAHAVTLYFPADSGAVIVPVTRMVRSKADVNTAVMELAKGPGAEGTLEGVVPAGCGLIDVQVQGGVAKLNFTNEFVDLVENSDGGRLALKALVLTCTQFDGIDSVEIYVDGRRYDAGELGVPSFMNVADTIVHDYIQTQSAMLFED